MYTHTQKCFLFRHQSWVRGHSGPDHYTHTHVDYVCKHIKLYIHKYTYTYTCIQVHVNSNMPICGYISYAGPEVEVV